LRFGTHKRHVRKRRWEEEQLQIGRLGRGQPSGDGEYRSRAMPARLAVLARPRQWQQEDAEHLANYHRRSQQENPEKAPNSGAT
jgi:hypothetical protein